MGYTLYIELSRSEPFSEAELDALDDWATETSEGLTDSSESIEFYIDVDGVVTAVFKPGLGHDVFPDIERCCTRGPLLLSLAPGVAVRITNDDDQLLYQHGSPSDFPLPRTNESLPSVGIELQAWRGDELVLQRPSWIQKVGSEGSIARLFFGFDEAPSADTVRLVANELAPGRHGRLDLGAPTR